MKRKFGFSLLAVALLVIVVGCEDLLGPQGFDAEAPVITLSGGAEVLVYVGEDYTDAGATAQDQVDGNLTPSIVVNGTVDTSVPGSYVITYNVTDTSGNKAVEVRRTVVVTRGENPVISLTGAEDVVLYVGEEFIDEGCTAADVEDGDITSYVVVQGDVDTTAAGTYTITYQVIDSHGNIAENVIRTVRVSEGDIPVITLTGDAEITLLVGAEYTDAGVTAADTEDGNLTADVIVTGAVDTSAVGTYTITYNVTDSNGNTAVEVTRTVTVSTGDIPVITLAGNAEIALLLGAEYTDAGATAADTEDGVLTAEIVTAGTVDTSTVGTYTITYNVTDSHGNVAVEVTRTVIVAIGDIPVITLVGDAEVSLFVGEEYTDAGATASDTEDGVITADIVTAGTVDTATAGTYSITYNVTDSQGNPALEVVRTVIVEAIVPVSVGFQDSHTMDAETTYNIGGGYVNYSDGSGLGVAPTAGTFSSSDESIAYVQDFILYAVAEGTCVITFSYTENGTTVSADMALTVNAATVEPVVPVSVNYQADHTMTAGTTYAVGGGYVNYSDDTGVGVAPTAGTFSSSDESIAYVQDFILYAVAEGTCTITFSYTEEGVTVTGDMALTVNAATEEPVVPVSVNYQADHTMTAGTTYAVGGGYVNYSDDTGVGVAPTAGTFSSSDESIAYVQDFILYAVAEGTCTITFSYTEEGVTVTGDMALTVNAASEEPVVPVSVNYQATHTMTEGTTYAVGGGYVNYSDDTGVGVAPTAGTFSSSDESIAYVQDFILYAVAEGTCTITFSYTEEGVTVTGDMALTVNAATPVASLSMPYGIYSEGTEGIVLGTNGSNGVWTNGTYAMNVSDTTDVFEGAEAISFTYDANSIGGGFISFNTASDISDATELVFTIKPSVALTSAEIKLEWTGGNASVDITSYTPVSSDGWDTYTIPLSDFAGINKEAITVAWSLWHPNGGYTGVIYIDNIIYQ